MSRYARLQELLKDNSGIDLSFYPDCLLNLRSILADWVEKQNWSEILCCDAETQASRSEDLLKESLALLQEKLKTTQKGFEFHIRRTETDLKKKYEDQPLLFVEEMYNCFKQEDRLTSTIMPQGQAMNVDGASGCYVGSAEDLGGHIRTCHLLAEKIKTVMQTACIVLQKWRPDIENRSTTLRDVFENGNLHHVPLHVFARLKEELTKKTSMVIDELRTIFEQLGWHITQWKNHQMYHCVSRKPEGKWEPDYVEKMCEQVCECVKNLLLVACSKELEQVDSLREATAPPIPTPSIMSVLNMALKDCLVKILSMFFVVLEQPDLTMMIEKEKGQKDKDADTNIGKKFKTAVGVLGGRGFGDLLQIEEIEIYLAFSSDLAEAQQHNVAPRTAFKILTEKASKRRVNKQNMDTPEVSYQKNYENLRVEHFSRKETKNVYKQLYHVVFNAKIQFTQLMQTFDTTAYSLPIIVRTGAVQASEHVGAQLWHSYSALDMYNLQGHMATTMKVTDVIQMMNERILYIGGRGLMPYEIEFLRERLTMAATHKSDKTATQANITLDTFIKDKVTLPRHNNVMEKDVMNFSLWRWFHSVVNLLQTTLKEPWVDGVIYGFAGREHCRNVLEAEGVPDGAFLLRYSESSLSSNHMLSKGAVAVVVRQDGAAAFAPPIEADKIEKCGLARLIENINVGCQTLLGTQLTVTDLHERYPSSKTEETAIQGRYMGWSSKEIYVQNDSDSIPGSPSQYSVGSPPAPAPIASRKIKVPTKRSGTKGPAPPGGKNFCPNLPPPPPPPTESSDAWSRSSVSSSMPASPMTMENFQPVGMMVYRNQPGSEMGSPAHCSQNIPNFIMAGEGERGEESGRYEEMQVQVGGEGPMTFNTDVGAQETVVASSSVSSPGPFSDIGDPASQLDAMCLSPTQGGGGDMLQPQQGLFLDFNNLDLAQLDVLVSSVSSVASPEEAS